MKFKYNAYRKRDLNLIGFLCMRVFNFCQNKPNKEVIMDAVKEFQDWELIEGTTTNHLLIALSQASQKEVVGKQDNPEILKYFNALGFQGKKLHDETSWCAAFVNWCLKTAGFDYLKKLNARSFLEYGVKVEQGDQQMGDIVVFWRGEHEDELIPGSTLKKGHVGFYIREIDNWIYVLGGNQSNTVKVSAYPKNKLLGYRRVTNNHK